MDTLSYGQSDFEVIRWLIGSQWRLCRIGDIRSRSQRRAPDTNRAV